MAVDPFAQAADEAQAEAPKTEGKPTAPAPEVGTTSDGRVTLTFKSGGGFADPWIVIYASSVQDAYDQISGDNAVLLIELMKETAKAAKFFATQSISPAQAPRGGGNAGGGNSGGGNEPQPKPGDPEKPKGWSYKTGSKNGKTWRAYFPPQGSDDKPIWLK